MNKLDAQRQKEIEQAGKLLFAGPQALGFTKGLFQGHFVSDWVMPYPRIAEAEQPKLEQTLVELRRFLNADLDPAEIDRQAEWPDDIRRLLAEHDILGIPFAERHGGLGADLLTLCLAIEQISRVCATSGLIVAVQALGAIPIEVAGTAEQQDRWLPDIASGERQQDVEDGRDFPVVREAQVCESPVVEDQRGDDVLRVPAFSNRVVRVDRLRRCGQPVGDEFGGCWRCGQPVSEREHQRSRREDPGRRAVEPGRWWLERATETGRQQRQRPADQPQQ